ncbi:hypothetical protein PS421_01405 [Pediococcus pentosaceus]|uniref:hypothetical protein n=1 Tax=Pediococcus pentosaceus TaxID=1255 RepID=UPI002F2673BD
MDLTTLNVIIAGGITFLGALVGSRIGSKSQLNSTKVSVKKDLKIAQMNIEQKLVADNNIAWSNQTRTLLTKFVRQCFEINQIILDIEVVEKHRNIRKISDLSGKQINYFNDDVQKRIENIKGRLPVIDEAIETIAMLQLTLFRRSSLEKQILDQALKIKKCFDNNTEDTKFNIIADEDINELIELSRKYFKQQWDFLTEDV